MMVEQAQCEMLIAASLFNKDLSNQSIQLTDDDYNGSFTVKEFLWDDDTEEYDNRPMLISK